ncbi:MAG TPA: hypothetical protein VD931_16315 [Baekduia sp.]|nr:hypothetical protein [Baekduia sp.]
MSSIDLRDDLAQRDHLAPHLRTHALADLATRQKGVVAHRQLEWLGYSPKQIGRLLAGARLRPLHRGVYALGHDALHRQARWSAAVLVCGDDALLAGRAAGALRDLLPVGGGPIEVAIPAGAAGRGHEGIRPLLRTGLTDADRDVVDGIPCVSVARVALDVACSLRSAALVDLLEQALRLKVFDLAQFAELLDRCRGQRGVRRVAAAMAELSDEPDLLRSELERRIKHRIRSSPLSMPRFNVHVAGASGRTYEVDAVWLGPKLVLEADGAAYHASPAARRRDERKQTDLEAAGLLFERARWHDAHGGWPALEARLFARGAR